MSNLDDLVLELPCPFCGVAPGEWCVTVRVITREPGKLATWLHSGRSEQVRQAYRIGWREGQIQGYETVRGYLQAAREGVGWARGVPTPPDDRIERWLQQRADDIAGWSW